MIGFKQAISCLNVKYPKRKIVKAIDYDSKWYLFMAVEDPDSVDMDSPWYAVSKQNGAVRCYNPVDELEKFTEAAYNRVIDI